MTLHNHLQPLHDLDRTSPQFHKQLIEFLRGNDYRDVVPILQREELVWLVEYLGTVLVGISDPASLAFQESLHELGRICGIKGLLPRSCTLPDPLLANGIPSTPGCACEIKDGSRVRIKRVRVHTTRDLQKVKEVAVAWKHSVHPNIVPLLGVVIDPLQFILEWMSGGDLTEYITNNPDVDRLSLLSDVAEGLNYLHYCNVIHGDLKGSNILVDTSGHARITDFGLAMVTQDLDSIRNALDEHGHSARWIAPEILDDRGTYSKEADVFSFAMVMIEVFTGAVPFSDKSPRAAMLALVAGERLPRPTHSTFTDGLWELAQRCWDQDVHIRPKAPEVLWILHSFGVPTWKRLISRPLAARECIPLITAIFSDKNDVTMIQSLGGDDAQAFVNVIDELLDTLTPWLWGKCLNALRRICGRHALLPESVQIPLCYNRLDTPLYRGGFADVWKGEHQGRQVAVKVLRVYSMSDFGKITSRFCKEVVTWKTLRHPNILPLLGVVMGPHHFAMASEWMTNGNINEFIKVHRDANRFELLKDVARGLIYLHGRTMVHGDLKGANILIDQNCHALLADFGLLTITSDPTNSTASGSTKAGTARWMSPELLDPDHFGFENSRPTKGSDCYALGMVILEVLTGQPPFPHYRNLVVMRKVTEGHRPGRPEGKKGIWFTDDLWGVLELCWENQRENRPSIKTVLECLGRAPWPLPKICDDSEAGTNDELGFTSDTSEQTIMQGSDRFSIVSQFLCDVEAPTTIHTDEDKTVVSITTPEDEDELGCTRDSKGQGINPRPSITSSDHPVHVQPSISERSRCDTNGDDGGEPGIRIRPFKIAATYKFRAVAKRNNAAAALQTSTRGEAPFREFANSSLIPEQSRQRAAPLLNSKDLLRNFRALTLEDQTKFIDKVDRAYPTIHSPDVKPVITLGDLCSATERLPTSALLSTGLEKRGNIAVASGGFTDVWRGEYYATQVAIKAFRIYPAQDLKEAKKILWKRVPVWRKLSHENILSFHGVTTTLFQLALVYDWGHNGNIRQYLVFNPRASRASLLLGVAKGLEYLHSLDIPHGDLKGANVVIDKRGRARLTEYGLAPINSDPRFAVAATSGTVGTSRWLAPELITPARKGSNMPVMESKAADVFAFGMLAVEVFTGKVPFEEQKNEAVVLRISRGGRPEMPGNAQAVGLTGEMWKLLESCWQQNPKKRPTMKEVVRRWQGFVGNNSDNNSIIEDPAGLTPRQRARIEAIRPVLRTEDSRSRTMSEFAPSRTKPETLRLRTTSEVIRPVTVSEDISQRGTKPEAVQWAAPRRVFFPEAPISRKADDANASVPTYRKRFCGFF